MKKKYQVFVSSTFTDLIEERQGALKAILDMGHIPSGMEGFAAADQEQLKYIKKIIDECDYYILIIAARYGSVDHQGMSYTEREYWHALYKKKPILAFIHKNPGSLSIEKADAEKEKSEALEVFRNKVRQGRIVSHWGSRDELQAQIIISLLRATTDDPRTGWVKGDAVASDDLIIHLSEAKAQIATAKQQLEEMKSRLRPTIDNIASLDDSVEVAYKTRTHSNGQFIIRDHAFEASWKTIFLAIGPSFFSPKVPRQLEIRLGTLINEQTGNYPSTIRASDLDQVKIQMIALKLLESNSAKSTEGYMIEFMVITELGKSTLIELLAVRRPE